MADIAPKLLHLSAEKLTALHERIHKSEATPATIEVHHTVLNEMARRKMERPQDDWDKYEILVDSVESVDLESLTASLPENALDELVKATGSYIANIQTFLTVNGYEMRFEPVELNNVEKMIRREDGWWVVYNKEGTRSFGKYKSKADAHKRLAQIEYFAKMKWIPPKQVRESARQGFQWIMEGKGNATSVQKHYASLLASGEEVNFELVNRINNFFKRNESKSEIVGFEKGEKGFPTDTRVIWDSFGGDAGYAWVQDIIEKHLQGQHDQKSHAPKYAEGIAQEILDGGHPTVNEKDVGPLFAGLSKLTTHPDITELKVEGTLLFGDEGMGIARKDMPQVPAERRDEFLKDLGVDVSEEDVDPKTLKPIQKEVSGSRSGAIYMRYKDLGEIPDQQRILISKDGYVIDGHHTWGAAVAFSFENSGAKLPVYRIDMNAKEALDASLAWTKSQGIEGQAIDAKAPIKKHGNHDQRSHGNWAHGGETADVSTEEMATRRAGMMARRDIPPMATDARGRVINPDATGDTKNLPNEVEYRGQTLTPQDSLWHHMVPDGQGGFELSQERALLHSQIIAYTVGNVPQSQDPTFYMLGGGPATGKSTLIKSGLVDIPDKSKAVHVNADDAKEMLPENTRMRNSNDDGDFFNAAAFVHEESSMIAKAVQAKAIRNNQDLVLDGTGNSSISKLASKVEQARQNGYKVNGVYATVPTDMAWARASTRALGSSRRFVPETVVRETHASVSKTLPLAMEADLFDSVTLWDTSTPSIKLIASKYKGSAPTGTDSQAWKDFVAKGNK